MFKNKAKSDAPRITSGVAIGKKIIELVTSCPRKRYRIKANEIMVPKTVATMVTTRPILTLTQNESQMVWSRQMFVQAASENSFQVVFCLPLGLLKLNKMMTSSGSIK